MGQGFISKYILRGIADFIRGRKNTTAEIKPVDMVAELESIPTYEQGRQAEYDAFWNVLQQNGTKTWYWGCFAGAGWTDEIFKPIHPFDKCTNTGYMFRHSKITHIPRVETTEKNIIQTFYEANGVHTIDCFAFNIATSFNQTFYLCSNLENLIIEGTIAGNGFNVQWSKKLSHNSIVSIMICLSTTTSGLSIILPEEAVKREFTDEEWAELVASRPNWTIVLV